MSQRTGETRGSQLWLQTAVNDHAAALDAAIVSASAGRIAGPLAWKSPLRADDYREYQDAEFLRRLDIKPPVRPLLDFWPSNGPHWDGLAVSPDRSVILVEAKAHPDEVTSECKATSPRSQAKIQASLRETQQALGIEESRDWTRAHYQYANRLAHLHFLRTINGVNAWLVFLYLVGDEGMGRPSRAEDWHPVERSIHDALGIRKLPAHVVSAYLDVRSLGVPTR